MKMVYAGSIILATITSILWYESGDLYHAGIGVVILGIWAYMFYPRKEELRIWLANKTKNSR